MSRLILMFSLVCLVLAGAMVSQAVAEGDPVQTVASSELATVDVAPIDLEEIRFEDEAREANGLPPRYAIPHPVSITPASDGLWETLADGRRQWRLRIVSPGALSLNLGFTRFVMPAGGQMLLHATDKSYEVGPITDEDNDAHGEFWSPVLLADDIVVEITLPDRDAEAALELELGSINHGYRLFGEPLDLDSGSPRSGSCNNDVVCPEGDPWRDEIPSVGVISTGGSTFCTGFMINNTAEDETPYFMTANHCGIDTSNDQSLVVYWNFESPTCGQHGGGSLSQYQTGSVHLASGSASDFTLVLLDDDPNPAYEVTFAGWDRSTADPTSAVAIHHPSTDEKSISFENDPCSTTTYLEESVPGNGTHIRVTDWDDGTTEGGSSGSPLFDKNHHVVGQLHGGYASCTSQTSDWYGRFSYSWNSLSSWLDPISSGAMSVDTLVPGADGLKVTPSSGFDSAGDPGGPFTPSSAVYTLENLGASGFNYSVTKNASWLTITNGSGYLSGGGGTAVVTVSINSNANSLGDGVYTDTVSFTNTTTGQGNTSRLVSLQVGGPGQAYFFSMDSNPGWTTEGTWAFGQPSGSGGSDHGNADPSSGYTGSNVYGYNLNGDYTNDMPERHLTSTAIDCSDLSAVSLKFRRWLNVERNSYDHAYVRVSNNGTSWTTIWENGVELTDSAWSLREYDISAVADGQPTLYLRWTMGTTDGSWLYSGWNIDDVEIWGIDSSAPACEDGFGNMDGVGGVDGNDIQGFLSCYLSDDPAAPGCACADMYPGTPNGTFEIEDVESFVDCLLGITCP